MDVFLEDHRQRLTSPVLSRLAIASPLRAMSLEDLIAESESLSRQQIRYVAIRRQQVQRIGEHSIREILDDHGISVSCLGFAGGFTGALGQSYETAVRDVFRAVEMADLLNARGVVIVPGNRGLHTYRHAERIVRDGLDHSALVAEQTGIRLFVPTDTVLADHRDCFKPAQCAVEWISQLEVASIRPMIVVRGAQGAWRLPRGWRESLATGGCIRICHRCDQYDENADLLKRILGFLNRQNGSRIEP